LVHFLFLAPDSNWYKKWLVDQAGQTMEQIVEQVDRVARFMSEITSASREQSQGIEQVNQAIAQMDAVTQQNAAMVE
jgi:methyl-accepting chemotaxis protein